MTQTQRQYGRRLISASGPTTFYEVIGSLELALNELDTRDIELTACEGKVASLNAQITALQTTIEVLQMTKERVR